MTEETQLLRWPRVANSCARRSRTGSSYALRRVSFPHTTGGESGTTAVHDENANPCNVHHSLEKPYMDQIFKVLLTATRRLHKVGDISLIQSTNPAFSQGQVLRQAMGAARRSQHSSVFATLRVFRLVQAGLTKIKGYGVLLDSGAGECADFGTGLSRC